MDRRNTRAPDHELAGHPNCHAKQNALEGPDLQGRGQQETTKG